MLLLRPFFAVHIVTALTPLLVRLGEDVALVAAGESTPQADVNLVLGVAIAIVAQMRSSLTLDEIVIRSFWVLRMASALVLYLYAPRWLLLYVVLVLVALLVVTLPEFEGPSRIVTLTSEEDVHQRHGILRPATMQQRPARDSSSALWVVLVYASGAYSSYYSQSYMASLSLLHHDEDLLHFAQLDARAHPNVARLFEVTASSILPAFLIVDRGIIVRRLPSRDDGGNDIPVLFTSKTLSSWLKIQDLVAEARKRAIEAAGRRG